MLSQLVLVRLIMFRTDIRRDDSNVAEFGSSNLDHLQLRS